MAADCMAVQNANAALVFEFAYRFINLGRSYFGKLDEESVKNNFVSVLPLFRRKESGFKADKISRLI